MDIENTYSDHVIIYSDGSGFEGNVGSAAVTHDDTGRLTRRLHLGKLAHHTVYESEVVGIMLAADIIREIRLTKNVAILLDNQAAIRSLDKRKSHSGQHLVLAAQNELTNIAISFPDIEITVAWIPGHSDVDGNEEADREAKDAALGFSSTLHDPAEVLLDPIPISVAALKADAKKRVTLEWERRWKKSKQRRKIAHFDRMPPSNAIGKFYMKCDRRDASLITQLRSQHIPLASYLHRIKAIDSNLCQRCGVPETVDHFLLTCQRWRSQREQLRFDIGKRRFNLTSLLAIPKTIKATLNFVHSTNHFPLMSQVHRSRIQNQVSLSGTP